jgi:carbon-monoxide dehydrogenase medium subunit
MTSFELVEPRSLEEAFALLDRDDPTIRPIAGGTALMLMMKGGLFRPLRLVSLRRIEPRFAGIAFGDGSIRIGAMTPLATLEHSSEIRRHLPVVTRTMRTLANARVRNVATIGGNLAHADTHLDLPLVWIALGAQAVIVSPRGERVVAVEDLYTGYYETVLLHDELITALHVPLRPAWRSAYVKVTTRTAHDWPALGIAVSLETEGATVTDARIAIGAATEKATRLIQAETVLRGISIDDAALARVSDAAIGEIEISADNRGSASYKEHLLRVYLGRAVRAAIEEQRS